MKLDNVTAEEQAIDKANLLFVEKINQKFCTLVGIQPLKSLIGNFDNLDYRAYYSKSSCYRIPKRWQNDNVKSYAFKNPVYPDFVASSYNFSKLLAADYSITGSIEIHCTGPQTLPVQYLSDKVRALEMMSLLNKPNIILSNFKTVLINQVWEYNLEKEVTDEDFQIVLC